MSRSTSTLALVLLLAGAGGVTAQATSPQPPPGTPRPAGQPPAGAPAAAPAAPGAAAALAGQGAARVAPPTGPMEEPPFHDPVMIRAGKTYYAFGTGRGVSVWSSPDMKVWTSVGPALPTPPEWIKGAGPSNRGDMWAPDIIERGGTYYLYYAVSAFGRNTSAIGVATNVTLDPADPRFKWQDRGMVVQSVPGRDMWNAIDPNVVIDSAGTPWLDFGSFWGGIKMVKLDSALTRLAQPEDWRTIAARARYWKLDERDAGDAANPELKYDSIYPARITQANQAMQNGAIEGPIIFYKAPYWYLFASWDRCCRGVESSYKVVVGRSKDITGPYVDREGEKMIYGGGSLVVQGLGESPRWAAGGHNDAVTFDGVDYLVFHAYDKTDQGRSKLLIRPITWDRHGWPSVEVDAPMAAVTKGKK